MKNIIMYSTDWCGDCVRSKAFMKSINVPFEEINVDHDEKANSYIQELQNGARRIPTIVFPDQSFLVEPNDLDLHSKLKELGII
tara:strand:+ start:663 stop:914 length:252 start_codon:yes stop_codon:yes gene_type:complete